MKTITNERPEVNLERIANALESILDLMKEQVEIAKKAQERGNGAEKLMENIIGMIPKVKVPPQT